MRECVNGLKSELMSRIISGPKEVRIGGCVGERI